MAISKSTKQAVGRPQVETSVSAPGLVVAARPSNFKTGPVNIDKRGASGLRGIAEGIASLAPFLNRERVRANEAVQQREFMVGQKLRTAQGAMDAEQYQKFLEDNDINSNRNRARGSMAAHGRAQAMDARRKLSEFMTANAEDIVTEEQRDQVIASFYASELEGMEDPDFLDNWLPIMGAAEDTIKENWASDQYTRTQVAARADITEGLKGDLVEAKRNGADSQQLHGVLRGYYDLASMTGVDRNAMNEIAFETVSIAAEEAQDPSMLDVFKIANNDVDNPEKRIPGLANSPKWQARIHDEGVKIQRSIKTKTTKLDQMAVYNARGEIESYMENSEWERGVQAIEQGIKDGLWGSSPAMSMKASLRKEQKAEEVAYNQALAYKANMFWAAGMTDAEKQGVVDDDAMEVTLAMVDASSQIDADNMRQTMRQHQSQNATMDSSTRNLITEASTSNEAMFVPSNKEFNKYRSINQRNLYNQIGEEAYRTHMMFNKAFFAGFSTKESLLFVGQVNTPEARKMAKAAMTGKDGWEMRDRINEEIISGKYDVKYSILDKDVSNAAVAMDRVRDNVMVYFSGTGDMPAAMEFGIDAFTARHHLVEFPDGEGSRWVDYGGRNMSEDWGETEKAFSNDPDVRQKLGLKDGEYVYFLPNPNDPASQDMLVMRNDGRLIPETDPDGRLGPWKVNADKLINERRTAAKLKELEDAKAAAVTDNVKNQLQEKIRQDGEARTAEAIKGITDTMKQTLTGETPTDKSRVASKARAGLAGTSSKARRGEGLEAAGKFADSVSNLFKKPQK